MILPRILKFIAVGALGLSLKFGTLFVMKAVLGLSYLPATALAVETVIFHNFFWHTHWTWRDRSTNITPRETALRLLRLHFTSGAVAMLANLAVMRLLVGGAGMHYLAANILATILAGTLNFILGNWYVFVPTDRKAPPSAIARSQKYQALSNQ